ncbi:Obg family GTPase CgtA [Candidatus Vampirococcus lugosii]|uniref:GTPase Obg n=1 Tax=Candidatus Vampirococcus lugosii TaxID=2789015 RepID=A0ABS5QKI2_9BACT|nr:GTPase CgtA [Candidatus Vampirococcus lugosii]
MKFYDRVNIEVFSGKGGNGASTGRREAKVPYGGPSGGDGGRGGNIIFRSTYNENTLLKYRYQKIYKAQSGKNGQGKDMYGKSGDDLILYVPVGTLIKDLQTGQILNHFSNDGEEFLLVKGGRGGWGNIHFKNSINQYPEFALLGEPGIHKKICLELQLLGDLCLIGTPSVGKSTIINSVSNAKAKVADYPFTTLIPNLGMVKHYEKDFCIVDVPGLVYGASSGKGLGYDFLRHILKSSLWTFVFDVSKYDEGIKDFSLLFDEIIGYLNFRYIGTNEFGEKIDLLYFDIENDENGILFICKCKFNDGNKKIIFKKYINFVVNKLDLLNDEEIVKEYNDRLLYEISIYIKKYTDKKIINEIIEKNITYISAVNKFGIQNFLDNSYNLVKFDYGISIYDDIKYNDNLSIKSYIKNITQIIKEELLQGGYIEENFENQIWEVYENEFSYFSYILPWGNEQAEKRFWDKMNKEGILTWFHKNGIKYGDVFKVINNYNLDPIYIKYE